MSLELHNQMFSKVSPEKPVIAAGDPVEHAIILWAEASTRTETRDRDERLRDKQQIIRSFLAFVGKHPGDVDPLDVRDWRKHLESKKSETLSTPICLASSLFMSG